MDAIKLTDLQLADALNANRKDFSLIVSNIQILEAELKKRLDESKPKSDI